jgi:hypothetical protein
MRLINHQGCLVLYISEDIVHVIERNVIPHSDATLHAQNDVLDALLLPSLGTVNSIQRALRESACGALRSFKLYARNNAPAAVL